MRLSQTGKDITWRLTPFFSRTRRQGRRKNPCGDFLFNKPYIKDLIGAGYKAKSVEEGTVEQMYSTLSVPVPAAAV